MTAVQALPTLDCTECGDPFYQKKEELFCCEFCRYKFWKKHTVGSKKIPVEKDLNDVKCAISELHYTTQNLKRNVLRVENDYGDWEDRVKAIEDRIYQLGVEVEAEERELDNRSPMGKPLDIDTDYLADVFGDL